MPISSVVDSPLARPFRRRLARNGMSVDVHTVTVTRSVANGYAKSTEEGSKKALHFVSGHWRISPNSIDRKMVWNEWRIWIEGHWRGDPAYGVILHRYVAKMNKVETRKELAA